MTEISNTAQPGNQLRGVRRSSLRVWCLVAGVGAGALGLLLFVHLSTHSRSSLVIPWWALAVAMTVAEVLQVNLTIRRHTISASLIEIPLVIGLIMSGPHSVVIAQLVGCAIGRGVIQRQAAQKLAFNLALCALESTAAIVVFGIVAGAHPVQSPFVWLAAYLAVLAQGVVSFLGLAAVMAIVAGVAWTDLVGDFVLSSIVFPIAGTALALQACVMFQIEPVATVLFAVTFTLVITGYRAYAILRARYANLQLLYQFTDAVKSAPESRSMIEGLLQATRQVLNAEVAELILSDGTGGFHHYLTTAPGRFESRGQPTTWTVIDDCAQGLLASRGTKEPKAVAWLAAQGWEDGMVVPIHRDGQTVATLAVANREDDVATFDREHFRLFGTLANHAAVSLENTELIERLTFEAYHDALTELGNRQEFHRRLTGALQQRQAGQKIAVALIDLDRFKEINDTLGHHTGDEMLTWLGRRINTVLPPHAVAARLGGDEFAVYVAYEGTKTDALDVMRTMLAPLWTEPFHIRQAHLDVDVCGSVGVAVAPDDAEDAPTLLQRADVAMYTAKGESGIGNVAPYKSERDTNSAQKLALAAELRTAISEHQLDVCFQPQVDLASGLIASTEALVRWSHPQRGQMSPDEFIPLAERTGLIVPLTELVLDRALRACNLWRNAGTELSVAVNVSVRSLGDGDIVHTVQGLLAQHQVPPHLLTIEVTESGVMEDERRNVGILEALAQLGVRLAIDDFGTGYSSLAYLKQLPVNEVKIDKSFVMGMEDNTDDAAIVRSIIELARNLRLSVVAEGVETRTAFDMLTKLGCTTAQGYFIGRAVTANTLLDIVTQWNTSLPGSPEQSSDTRLRHLQVV